MKMRFLVFTGLIVSCVIFSCNNKNQQDQSTQKVEVKSSNTDSFNIAFDSVLTEYDNLKTAFINWDTSAANKSATQLMHLLVYVPYEQLHDEAVATKATSIMQNAEDVLQNLLSQDSIADKRRIFYTASESIYNLIKTVGYDKEVIYHKKCPMAFNGDQEGWWISETKKVNDNPYFGKFHPKYKNAMLECGSVEDSVNNVH